MNTDLFLKLDWEIRYDRKTKDYSLLIDGRYVGSAPTYLAGEKRMNELMYEMLTHQMVTVEQEARNAR